MTIPVLKIKITPKPIIKGKMDVRFPANSTVSDPLTLDRTGGNYLFGLSVTNLRLSLDALYAPIGSGSLPGGLTTQLQYNNAGAFGGITGATSNGTTLSVATAPVSTNTTQAASTAFVLAQIAASTSSPSFGGI